MDSAAIVRAEQIMEDIETASQDTESAKQATPALAEQIKSFLFQRRLVRWGAGMALLLGLGVIAWNLYGLNQQRNSSVKESNTELSATDNQDRTEEEQRAFEEFEVAEINSWYVIGAIMLCYNVQDTELVSGVSRWYLDLPKLKEGEASVSAAPLPLTGLDRAILTLNREIKYDRYRTYRNSLTAQSSSRWWQASIIIMSALATVLVAIKAADPDGKAKTVGYFALLLSAAATAATSWSAFTSNAALANSSQQRLSTIQVIHHKLLHSGEKFYSGPLCSLPPRSRIMPVPGEPLPKSASEWTRTYASAMDEISKLRTEYIATLQATGAAPSSGSGRSESGQSKSPT